VRSQTESGNESKRSQARGGSSAEFTLSEVERVARWQEVATPSRKSKTSRVGAHDPPKDASSKFPGSAIRMRSRLSLLVPQFTRTFRESLSREVEAGIERERLPERGNGAFVPIE
jgi:hypothetical protein